MLIGQMRRSFLIILIDTSTEIYTIFSQCSLLSINLETKSQNQLRHFS